MKNKLIYLLLLIFVLIAAISCHDEDSVIIPDEVENAVNFSINIPGLNLPSTYAMDAAKQNEVKEVNIFIFSVDGSGNQKYIDHKEGVNVYNANDGTAKFHAMLEEGNDRNILIVANAKAAVNNILSSLTKNVSTKTEVLEKLEYSKIGKWAADGNGAYTNIPMIVETGKMDIVIGMKIKNISLVRMLARIDIKIDENIPETKFKLENIYLCNYSTNGRISTTWDSKGVLSTTTATTPNLPTTLNRRIGASNVLRYMASGLKEYVNEIFTFEANAADESNGIDDPLRRDATCIVIEGKYEGQASFYRIDFVNNNNYIPVLRNHIYEFTVTQVNGKGKTSLAAALIADTQSSINVTQMSYIEGDLKDMIFNGRYMFGVDKNIFQTYSGRDFTGTEDFAKLLVYTTFDGGWTVNVSDNKGKTNPDWFGITQTSGSGKTQVGIKVNSSAADKAQVGYLDFSAGELQKRISFFCVDPLIEFIAPNTDGQIIDFGLYSHPAQSITFKTNAEWILTATDETSNNAYQNIIGTSGSHELHAENKGGEASSVATKSFTFTPSNDNTPVAGTKFETKLTFSTTNTGNAGYDKSVSLTLKRTVPVYTGIYRMSPGNDQEIYSGKDGTSTTVQISITANTEWVGIAKFDDFENAAINYHTIPANIKAERTSSVIIRQNNSTEARRINLYFRYKADDGSWEEEYVGSVIQKGWDNN